MKSIRIFLDSSVIIAGLASPQGGSREILNLAELRVLIPIISAEVVREATRNIEKKLPAYLPHFYHLFRSLAFIIVEANEESIKKAASLINRHDVKILASALTARVDWLISLDKHFLNIDMDKVPFRIGSPGDFLNSGDFIK
ncbi:MAG: PIN domain-containing protein [Syntrophomonas sp.]|uniref:PIN domain-containing protein n=1 Tax=Syntrophomonas sp. TaxID=2053627 RepID=UPI00262C7E47|nr:PIN domain-containing protein [Syntrophomonas sp.]MDD2510190.1 PIN domain-containing protein [Syntrophomonas sp.]MDD3880022.1 PIN domain-containing protein [Syntrophomonas sp.]MDD4625797.1 PIN domain-containing protein [Syntrophomonas sp.]